MFYGLFRIRLSKVTGLTFQMNQDHTSSSIRCFLINSLSCHWHLYFSKYRPVHPVQIFIPSDWSVPKLIWTAISIHSFFSDRRFLKHKMPFFKYHNEDLVVEHKMSWLPATQHWFENKERNYTSHKPLIIVQMGMFAFFLIYLFFLTLNKSCFLWLSVFLNKYWYM